MTSQPQRAARRAKGFEMADKQINPKDPKTVEVEDQEKRDEAERKSQACRSGR